MKIIKFLFPLTVLNLITLILITLGLPDIVPIHINLAGVVDGFGSKWYIPLFGIIPIFIIFIYIIYLYNSNNDLNRYVEDKLIPAIDIIFIVVSWIPMIIALNFNNINAPISQSSLSLEIFVFISILLAIFFVFMGYYLENIKPNKFLGIRTPWTLGNDIVWKKTHKLGSYTSMIAGFVLLVYTLATFISGNFIYVGIGLIIAVFLVAIIPIIYSFYEFKKIE